MRLLGRKPGGTVTSIRKFPVALDTGAWGVPVRVTVTFCETGAPLLALTETVADWPGRIVFGVIVAVVPGGSPLTESAMS